MYDLSQLAESAMISKGFIPTPPPAAEQEVDRLQGPFVPKEGTYRDLRHIAWVSIDNDDSRDLDQLTFAEGNKIFIAIADVDALVPKDSEVDKYAYNNTTSVYTPTRVFPMLPQKLSYDFTSLVENEDRAAVVTEIVISEAGEFISWDIYYAWVKNWDKLTYNKIGDELTKGTATPQIMLQDMHAQRIKEYRFKQGSLNFNTAKLVPEVKGDEVVQLKEADVNRANELIENFMIASNVVMARHLKSKNLPAIRRVVRTPKRWERIVELARELGYKLPEEPDSKELQNFLEDRKVKDPTRFPDLSLSIIKLIGRGEYVASIPGKEAPGHFDLAVHDYAHTTAPNRRYPDVISQRILKSDLFKQPLPYKVEEIQAIADHCTAKETDANKVERQMVKSAAAMYLSNKIGTTYSAMVSGVAKEGTWVRISSPPIEGKLSRGAQGLDVGDKLQVRLTSVNIPKGYIDFARI